MAMTFHSIERLGAPFSSVSELGFVIPENGDVTVENPERKLLFFLQANCTGEIDDFGSFTVRTGDILVVPRRCVQHYRVARAGEIANVHALKITFTFPLLAPPGRPTNQRVQGNPESDLSAFVRHHFREIRHLPGAQTPAMKEILRAIRRDIEEHPLGIRHRVRALGTNLVVHVARMVHETPSPKTSSEPGQGSLVNNVKEYLLRNYARPLTLGNIAWQVHKSEEHVARVIRKVTGQTVLGYLRTIRLEQAKTLLINSDKTLTEIARLTGFGSLALFSRNFAHYVGRSASAYRQERSRVVKWKTP
jgi:AraC-like DNA-binding protein